MPERKHDIGSEDGELADILAMKFDHEVIFNHGKNQWHTANPKTGLWLPDKVRDVPEMVDEIALTALTEVATNKALDAKEVAKLIRVFRKMRDVGKIESALKSLGSRDDYKTDGSIFDTQTNLLGVKNGVVDLSTGTLYDGKVARDMHVSQSCAVEWPDMTLAEAIEEAAPFLDFLADVMSGDAGVTDYILRLLGYCLLGTTEEEKFWLLVGDGRNGKGTLTKFILWLLGDYGGPLDPSLYIRQRFGDPGADRARPELGNLWGKRYTVTSEPVKGAFNDEMIKAHTGRDPITFRRMRSDVMWTFEPTHKLFFLTQKAPSVEDVGPSMRARARVIHFDQSYYGREDHDLKRKLQKVGPAVLMVLATYAQLYLKDGLPENDTVLGWSDEYINENDPLAQFVADRCEEKKDAMANATLVFDAYTEWCGDIGAEPMNQTNFGRALTQKYRKDRAREDGKQGWYYFGIRLLNAMELAHGTEEGESDG